MADAGWQDWVGRSEVARDVATAFPARALAATLNRADAIGPGERADLPPLWLWLYFLTLVPTAALDRDGHARRGGFMPAVPLPRRMWAGGRCVFPGTAGSATASSAARPSCASTRRRAGPGRWSSSPSTTPSPPRAGR